jgi:hypothetical protein
MTEEDKRNDRIVIGALFGYTAIAILAVAFMGSTDGDEDESKGYPDNEITWRHSEHEDPCGSGQWYSSCSEAVPTSEVLPDHQSSQISTRWEHAVDDESHQMPEVGDTGPTH